MPAHPLVPTLTPDQLVALASARYSTKAYDPARTAPAAAIDALLELLRQSPSSVNSQPWHFVVAGTPAARARVAKGMPGRYAYNLPKVTNASHVIVLCARLDMPESYLAHLLDQEASDGRFGDAAARATQAKTRNSYVDPLRAVDQALPHWLEKQTYLALGALLLGAACLGLDATPMEGFDRQALDAELGLADQGFGSLVVVTLGLPGGDRFQTPACRNRACPAPRW